MKEKPFCTIETIARIIERAEKHQRMLDQMSKEEAMPDTITLSAEAVALLKLHVTRERVMVDDENREAHRELARAGIMYPLSGFASGPESHYRFTKEGWRRCEGLISVTESDRP